MVRVNIPEQYNNNIMWITLTVHHTEISRSGRKCVIPNRLQLELGLSTYKNERHYRYCKRCLHGPPMQRLARRCDCCYVTKLVSITSVRTGQSPVQTVPAGPVQIRAHHHIDVHTDINDRLLYNKTSFLPASFYQHSRHFKNYITSDINVL